MFRCCSSFLIPTMLVQHGPKVPQHIRHAAARTWQAPARGDARHASRRHGARTSSAARVAANRQAAADAEGPRKQKQSGSCRLGPTGPQAGKKVRVLLCGSCFRVWFGLEAPACNYPILVSCFAGGRAKGFKGFPRKSGGGGGGWWWWWWAGAARRPAGAQRAAPAAGPVARRQHEAWRSTRGQGVFLASFMVISLYITLTALERNNVPVVERRNRRQLSAGHKKT